MGDTIGLEPIEPQGSCKFDSCREYQLRVFNETIITLTRTNKHAPVTKLAWWWIANPYMPVRVGPGAKDKLVCLQISGL